MSRIELAGYGTAIPTISLPDPNTSGERPTIELILENGVPFEKAAYVDLGYTHYEVWCVGGAGGQGGAVGVVEEEFTYTPEIMPLDVYNALKSLYTPISGQIWVPEANQWMNQGQYWDYIGFRNKLAYYTITGFHLVSAYGRGSYSGQPKNAMGGGGGGGGTHVVFGELEDLPDSVAVVVGVSGADAPLAQQEAAGPFTPQPALWHLRTNYVLGNAGDWPMHYFSTPAELANVALINAWWYRWPDPHTVLDPPQPGQDGQASSFGDVGKASGGKGGGPSVIWPGGVKTLSGKGGDGGVGNSLVAGGGGLGSNSDANALDGTWTGSIGGGGGGGRGGTGNRDAVGVTPGQVADVVTRKATAGGRGAFSYLDTTVYGQRGFPSRYVPLGNEMAPGELNTLTIVPGGGGGVRANHKRLVGSDAAGYLPDGMVLLRLIKLDE